MIEKIISGAQTGVDQGGLWASIDLNLKHGGFVPKGRKTELGNNTIPAEFTDMIESHDSGYRERTIKNVQSSDATVIFTNGKLTPGSRLTVFKCRENEKPFFHIDLSKKSNFDAAQGLKRWLPIIMGSVNLQVLNIAGSRESKAPGICQRVRSILVMTLENGLVKK